MTVPPSTPAVPPSTPAVPARSRGVIALVEENCTVCMLCVRECPDWCIEIEAHDETVTPPGGGRPRTRHVLDRFAIDFGLCLYCGICVDVCPFDALLWAPEASYAEADVRDLVHESERLRGWVEGVPLPPATDPAGEEAKEVEAARRAARRP